MNIKIKTRILGADVELDIENLESDVFDFLEELVIFLRKNEAVITTSSTMKTQESDHLSGIDQFQKLTTLPEDLKDQNYPNELITLAQDLRLTPSAIQHIFDFGAETEIPPILVDISGDSRTEKQRKAVNLLLYESHVLLNKDKITSQTLSSLLVKSNVDPSESSKAFKGDYSKYIKIEGRSYRITHQGLLQAKKLIEELAQNN